MSRKVCKNCKHSGRTFFNEVIACSDQHLCIEFTKWESRDEEAEKDKVEIQIECCTCKYHNIDNCGYINCTNNKSCVDCSAWEAKEKIYTKNDEYCGTCKYGNINKLGIIECLLNTQCYNFNAWESKKEVETKKYKVGTGIDLYQYMKGGFVDDEEDYELNSTTSFEGDKEYVSEKPDIINNPSHYTQGTIEVWDAIMGLQLGYFAGNIVKYVSRYKYKNGLEDLKKAEHYLKKLIEIVGEKK